MPEHTPIEEALRESEQRYRSLFEESPISLWIEDFSAVKAYFDELRSSGVSDMRGYFQEHSAEVARCAGMVKVLDVNQTTVDLLGAPSKQEVLSGLPSFFTDVSLQVFCEELIALAEGKRRFESLAVQRTFTGEEKYIALRLSVPAGYEETLGEVLVSLLDITDRLRTEEALKESEQKLAGIIDFLPDPTVVIDAEGRVIAWNRGMESLTGVEAEEMLGQGDYAYAVPFYGERRPILIDLVLRPREQFEREHYAAVRREGAVLTAEAHVPFIRRNHAYFTGTAAPLYDLKGRIAGAIEVIRDITARRHAEQERDALIGQLETKNAELERFVYTVSHDLKSPIISIKGFLGLLEQDVQTRDLESIREDMTRMASAADSMQRLTDELLELSRIGRVMNPPGEVALGQLAHEAVEILSGRLTARGVVVSIAPDLPVVRGDRQRLLEVLQNLIDNAVKYMGSQREPRVEVGVRDRDEETVVCVRDNGIGIEPQYQDRVFGLFEKLDPQTEGTGVGLSIVRRIVEVHGGRIWVESEGLGKGSTFCFTLGRNSPAPA